MKNIRIAIRTLLLFIILTANMCIPCLCAEQLNLTLTDRVLLTDKVSWDYYTEEEKFNYMLKFVPQMNVALGVPVGTFPAENVHMMKKDDPAYNKACAYTDYGTKQIYVNMSRINADSDGGWAAIYALAHETRHLYQSKYKTLPYNPAATIDNQTVYDNDPREKDANNFAYHFSTYILNCAGVAKIGDK